MMTQKIKKLAVLVSMLFVLVGCAKIEMNVEIIDEDTVNVNMVMLFEEKMYNLMNADGSMDFSELSDSYMYEGVTVNETTREIDGDTYVGVEIIGAAQEGDGILNSLFVTEKDGKETYSLLLNFSDLNMNDLESELGAGSYTVEDLQAYGFDMTLSITMPYAISEASVGEVNGDTVTLDLLELTESDLTLIEIVATEGSGSASMLLYIALGVIVLAGVAIFVILKKQKQQKVIPETISNDSMISTTPEPVVDSEEPINEETVETPKEETSTPEESEVENNSSDVEDTIVEGATVETEETNVVNDTPEESTTSIDDIVENINIDDATVSEGNVDLKDIKDPQDPINNDANTSETDDSDKE